MCGRQSYSIISSAVAIRVGGTARPSLQALMSNLNLVDCTTGKSAGFAPLRMRPRIDADLVIHFALGQIHTIAALVRA